MPLNNVEEGDHYPLTIKEASLIHKALLAYQSTRRDVAEWDEVERLFLKMYRVQSDYLQGTALK